tara:strand:- start:581 stop:781 length:201 start_codon:yes stop_codon:yes gene_type:complete
MSKQSKIDDLIATWIDGADLDTIYEYAEQKYAEWLIEQSEEWINETHEEFCGDWVPPEATKKVIET